jgi:hypothetical protein
MKDNTTDDSFVTTLTDVEERIAASDGFVLVPLSLVKHEADPSLYGIDAAVQFYDRLGLDEGDDRLEHMFLSAMLCLIQTCLERFDPEQVILQIANTISAKTRCPDDATRH